MFRFIARFFAVIGFLTTVLVVLLVWGFISMQERRANPEPESLILSLDFDSTIVEQSQPSPLQFAMHQEVTPLFDIIHAIDVAKNDPHVKGIVAHFGSKQLSLSQVQEIRAAMARFRETGKPTYAFAASYGDFGMGSKSYYLASAFENIWLQPVGAVGLSGIAMEMPFGKAALDKIGVGADFVQREEYKSAMDNITRDGFAPQVKIEMQAMLDDLEMQIAGGIAESRKWDVEHVKQLMADGPYTDTEAMKAGLVTKIGYADELDDEVQAKTSKDISHASVDDYLDYDRKHPDKAPPTVAVIYGSGMIVDKADGPGDLSGEELMGAAEIAGAFDDAADDKRVKAILFRVDSPGGSPEASETIRRAVVHAQKKGKPVIVSMGEVAASGGYWVAMNADRIVAEPATLTGSIGVIGGKILTSGLMQKLGVSWEMIKTTENAGMWSVVNDFTPAQKDRLNALMDQTYAAFVRNVSEARHIPIDSMPDITKGRVWTGEQASKIGLVDELGGYDAALAAIRRTIHIGEKDPVTLETFPAPETAVERAIKLLKNFGVESAMVAPAIWQWQKFQAAFGPVMRDAQMKPVELRMPRPVGDIR